MSESDRLFAIGLAVLSSALALGVVAIIAGAGSSIAFWSAWPILIAMTSPLFPKPVRRTREECPATVLGANRAHASEDC